MANRLKTPVLFVAALLLAVVVFWIDSMAEYDFAISILYLAVLVLVSAAGSGKAVTYAAFGCLALAILAWLIVHFHAPSQASALRCLFACLAISVTAALLVSRKKLEATKLELERNKLEFELFANNVPFVLWRSNPDGEIEYLNEIWTAVTGLDRWSVLEGQRYNDVVHPDDMEVLVETVTRAVKTQTLTNLKVRVRQADGAYRWMQIYDRPAQSPLTGKMERFGGLSDVHDEVMAKEELQRLQKELEASKDDLINFTDSVPQILWRTDAKAQVDFYNRRYTELTGRDFRTAIERQDYVDSFHPDDREEFFRLRSEALSNRTEIRMNYRLRHADGIYRWMSLMGRPVTSIDGVLRWYGGTSDAHDEILARQELQKLRAELEASRQELINFTNSVPQILFRADRNAQVDFYNERFTEVTGRDLNAVIEKQDWIEDFHPDDRPGYLDNLRSSFASGVELRDTFRLRHADGSYRWVSIVGRPVRISQDSDEIRYYGGVSDIHEEVLAHQKVRDLNETLEQRVAERTADLLRTERRYAGLFDVSSMTFTETDFSSAEAMLLEIRDSGISDVRAHLVENPHLLPPILSAIKTKRVNEAYARLMGYESVADMAANQVPLDAHDRPEILIRQLEMYCGGADHIDGRTVLVGKNGLRIPVYYSVSRLSDGLHLSSFVNLSEQERIEGLRQAAQAELARANRVATVGAYSASIAHELNQPIASMLMDAQTGLRLMKRESPDLEALGRMLQRVERAAQRVAGIVERTRDSIVAGRQSTQTIDLGRLASETSDLLNHDLRRANVQLDISSEDDLPLVQGDAVALQQVFVNLISNAVDAMRDRSGLKRIKVDIAADKGMVRVRVADTGPGISAEHIEKLFDPFFTTKDTGIGMGLQICRSTVEAMGGQLTAANGSGGGAVFTFEVPVALEDASQEV